MAEAARAQDWVRLLAPTRLEAFLREALGRMGSLVIEGRAPSGNSNVTAFIRFGDERLVVRRPPEGELLPTSHDMMREVRFLDAFRDTAVPVATVRARCEDPAVLGAPFYVMERKDGIVLQDGEPDHLRDPEVLGRLCDETIDVLANIHSADWRDRGLPGRPTGYLARQVARWSSQLGLTPSAKRLMGLERLTDWVTAHVPADIETSIVHGDYGFHNLIIGHDTPKVCAVLDWEMATLGDPIADLVWFLQGWGVDRNESGNPANYVTTWPGARTREQMLERYSARTGRLLKDELFYRLFSFWKGIIVTEGLYSAYLDGRNATPLVVRFETQIPARLKVALALLETA